MRSSLKLAVASFAMIPGVASASQASAQQTCGTAQMQLQQYVAQVNQIANYEYYQGIGMRCAGNMMCANMLLQQLNVWYQQQSYAVNNWYMTLVRTCASESAQHPPKLTGNDVSEGMSEDAVETLDVDDEDKTVVIRIPDNPAGFRPGANGIRRR